ncbi:LacI family DNA-binding transcriptional regulator [Veillonella sp. R32]|uniref:LacI family DNA-binding transcriptional regulator n=1 Tax=Veillonella sp. R32 TaxID=2021312 RepID=UPI00138A15A3|nr:LacI family DNA-binding transcriptional regulator [Veillonella sp. R32]KAF1683152.1 hypothetical protein VER_03455 [Veillonella sp. R32]
MATIKDVATLAGVSPTTVSVIINGKASERRISKTTCEKVYEAMKALQYTPDLSARKLRGGQDNNRKTIAFFWPSDFRSHFLSSFLTGMQSEAQKNNLNIEIVIQTYTANKLNEYTTALTRGQYHGAIIGACSEKDIKFLETINSQTPIVLLNRPSKRFSTINLDDRYNVQCVIDLIKENNLSKTALTHSSTPYLASNLRHQYFLQACKKQNLLIDEKYIFIGANSIKGGSDSVQNITKLPVLPEVIVCESDSHAIGVIHSLLKQKLRVPQDIKVIAMGFLNPDFAEFNTPSITTIEMPNMEIAKIALQTLNNHISGKQLTPKHIVKKGTLKRRESF